MKLITWNVQWFCGIDGRVDIERVVQHARALADFDTICMQEVACNYPALPGGAAQDQPALLAQWLPGFQVFFGAAVDEFRLLGGQKQRQRFGNLIATRLPVHQVQHHPLPYPADARPGGARSMPRMCSVVTVQAPWGPLRLMTTHLEFYSPAQRAAQVAALRALQAQACAQARHPPQHDETGWPFQNKVHSASALLCGDFNFEPGSADYQAMLEAAGRNTPDPADIADMADMADTSNALNMQGRPFAARPTLDFVDCWTQLNGGQAHAPTFRLFDRKYGPDPISCDFAFVSADLAPRLRRIEVDLQTQASDHQPVLVELV